MKEHQTLTRPDAAEIEDFITQLMRDTEREAMALQSDARKDRLSDAIEVLRLARQTFTLAVEMIVPFADD